MSPVLVASAVIGVVIILSCITIIVGSIRRDRQARLQRHRHRPRRRHHHHHRRRRRRRHRESEHGYGELLPTPGPGLQSHLDYSPGGTREVVVALPWGGGGGGGRGIPEASSDQEELRGAYRT